MRDKAYFWYLFRHTVLDRPGSYLRACREPELLQDVGDVIVDRPLGDHQVLRDLTVGQPAHDRNCDFSLTSSQLADRRSPCLHRWFNRHTEGLVYGLVERELPAR